MEIEKGITETWGIDANFFNTEGIRSITTEDARRLADDIRCRVEAIVRPSGG